MPWRFDAYSGCYWWKGGGREKAPQAAAAARQKPTKKGKRLVCPCCPDSWVFAASGKKCCAHCGTAFKAAAEAQPGDQAAAASPLPLADGAVAAPPSAEQDAMLLAIDDMLAMDPNKTHLATAWKTAVAEAAKTAVPPSDKDAFKKSTDKIAVA